MITEDQLHLMTCAVDGELTPSEAKRLRLLLDSSPEARAVYARLKADSQRIELLPHVAPPANLHNRIMARVATATPPAQRPHAEPAQPATLPFATKPARHWLPAAVAASLLFCAVGGSFWFFNRGDSQPHTARSIKRPPPNTRAGATDPAWANWLPSETDPRPSIPVTPRPEQHLVVRPDTHALPNPPQPPVVEPEGIAQAPLPRPAHDFFGARPTPETTFDLVQIRIPYLKALAELDRPETRQELAAELGREPPFRIDLFTRDPMRGVDVFQAAAKGSGLNVFSDATTMDRLKKRQITSVVIYTEAFTAAELAELFGKLCNEDAKISPHVFEVLHATPASVTDATDIKNILGIDPGLFKRPLGEKGEKGEKPTDPSKPISAGTADHIVKSVTKSGEKTAMLMTWAPAAGRTIPATSAELKQFVAKRGERKEKAVPVLIVIRPGN